MLAERVISCLVGTVSIDAGEQLAQDRGGLSGATSVFLAWLGVNVANQVSFYRSAPSSMMSTTRFLVHLYDIGQVFALGLIAAGLCGAYRRWGKGRQWLATLGLFVGNLMLAALVTPPDLSNMTTRLTEDYPDWVTRAFLISCVVAIAALIPIVFLFGRLIARPYLRWLGVLLGSVAFTLHGFVLQNGYHSVHLFIVLAGTTLFGASLAGATFPEIISRRFSRQPPRFVRNLVLSLVTATAAVAIGHRPPATAAAELTSRDTSLLPHFLNQVLPKIMAGRKAAIPPEMQEWFKDRTKHPPIAPSTPPIIPDNPIVIFITIDCLRADVVMSGKHDAQLPALAELRRSSTTFANARSTAPGTISSLASVFMSTHFSQQYWIPAGTKGLPFPDKSVRLQELLGKAKIKTVTFTAAPGLTPRFGLMRGFSESTNLQKGFPYASAETLVNAALPRIEQAQNEKLFLYLHFLEAHAPYDLGLKKGSSYDRYLSELQLVDAQLDRLKRFIVGHEFWNRTLLIVSADHGEAFGEHRTIFHSATIYEELLRVPLLMWRPNQKAATVDEPISLIDLAPTILDVFGVPTPGHFMGQSLVPFLRGENPKLTRPILAEARLKQALILPDGLKIIVDNHLNTIELFDLRTDPGELHSLAENEELVARPLSLVQQFFEVHKNKTPGYKPPYRVW